MKRQMVAIITLLSFVFIPDLWANEIDPYGSLRSAGLGQSLDWSTHIDNHRERGARNEMPWHFHSGEGVSVIELKGFSRRKVKASCTLDMSDPECFEKAYFFTESEILRYVNAAVKAYESSLRTHEIGFALSSAIVFWTGKIFWVGLVAPDPTVVTSKLVAAGAGLISGAMAIVTAWEGKKIYEIHETIEKVERVLAEERRYVTRCGHVSRNFLDRMSELGVEIHFLENGYEMIPGQYFLEGKAKEAELVSRAEDLAKEEAIPYQKAYQEIFQYACGQVAMVKSRIPTKEHPWALEFEGAVNLDSDAGLPMSADEESFSIMP